MLALDTMSHLFVLAHASIIKYESLIEALASIDDRGTCLYWRSRHLPLLWSEKRHMPLLI